nr:hypothetical protein Iba_chr03bCG7740 [Ipomoea batatas]
MGILGVGRFIGIVMVGWIEVSTEGWARVVRVSPAGAGSARSQRAQRTRPGLLYPVYGGPDPLKPSLAPSVGTYTEIVPPTEQPGGPTPGGNGGGDEVLVSVRAEGHPTLPEGRGHGDRTAQGSQPSAAEPPNGRRQDIIVPRPSQTDVRGRHVSGGC